MRLHWILYIHMDDLGVWIIFPQRCGRPLASGFHSASMKETQHNLNIGGRKLKKRKLYSDKIVSGLPSSLGHETHETGSIDSAGHNQYGQEVFAALTLVRRLLWCA